MSISLAPFAPGGPAAMDATLAQRLLGHALCRGGDHADLYFEYRTSASYVFEEGRVKTVGGGVSLGLGVRVLHGSATGYAYCEELTEEAMIAAARTAAQIARSGASPPPERIEPRALPSFYPLQTPSVAAPPEAKLDLLRRADAAARAFDRRIIKVECSFAEEIREILIVSSEGYMSCDVQPLIRFGVHVIAEEGGRRQGGSGGGGGRYGMEYFDAHPPEEHGREAARVATAMLHAWEAPAGEMEVVLAPGDSGILLHEAVGHGLEADFNRKRTSNYTDRIGQQVASPLCTVVDDGTIGHSRGSINVDDEGHPGQVNVLIEAGVLRGYMQDWLSARHFKTAPSGNGRRQSFRHNPLPRMTNTYLRPGPHDPEEIVRSVRRGVYARRFSGGQVNISNGDFVFSLTESYLIEDGRLTAPLKGVNLIGNGPQVLTRVTMLGNDFQLSDGIWTCGKDGQSVPVGVGTPTVKIAAITVGGTKA
ncbi:MAG: metallopeptidase TldD-related protein [Myxococcales bacterium]|nr:metallopeptidase TldD-related protein [Myxococcota bacterium]MDW8282970.1 metallopeptidase TldD-related protein [Myxococcales bacterium]